MATDIIERLNKAVRAIADAGDEKTRAAALADFYAVTRELTARLKAA